MAGPPLGDQSVFGDVVARIRISGRDQVDPGVQLSGGLTVNEPLILVSVEAAVQINDGEPAGRVPGLRVFADGFELQEIGSAAQLPTVEFPFQSRTPAHGQSVELEFRLGASSFFLAVTPPVVELTAPASGATVPSNQPLVLQWTGTPSLPQRASVLARDAGCVIAFRQTGPATFVPVRQEGSAQHEPPCDFEAFAEWLIATPPPPSPFASLELERVTARIAHFIVS